MAVRNFPFRYKIYTKKEIDVLNKQFNTLKNQLYTLNQQFASEKGKLSALKEFVDGYKGYGQSVQQLMNDTKTNATLKETRPNTFVTASVTLSKLLSFIFLTIYLPPILATFAFLSILKIALSTFFKSAFSNIFLFLPFRNISPKRNSKTFSKLILT